MKIIVTTPFRDKAFNNEIVREEGTIIDTDDESFRCDENLARERILGGFCVEVKEDDPKIEEIIKVGDKIIGFGPVEVKETKSTAKKGKKVSKKK